MEKQGVIREGITPPEQPAKGCQCRCGQPKVAATVRALEEDVKKRLSDQVANSSVSK